jgi:hypothetical protein
MRIRNCSNTSSSREMTSCRVAAAAAAAGSKKVSTPRRMERGQKKNEMIQVRLLPVCRVWFYLSYARNLQLFSLSTKNI